jgi:hypothetical protein
MIVIRVLTLAQEIGVHRNTIRNWLKTGRISAKPGPGKGLRFPPDDFARLCREFNLDPELLKTMARSRPGAEAPLARSASPPAPRGQDRPGKVVGGGIAGIQAALDLADSGYYFYRGIAFAHPYSFLTDDG